MVSMAQPSAVRVPVRNALRNPRGTEHWCLPRAHMAPAPTIIIYHMCTYHVYTSFVHIYIYIYVHCINDSIESNPRKVTC